MSYLGGKLKKRMLKAKPSISKSVKKFVKKAISNSEETRREVFSDGGAFTTFTYAAPKTQNLTAIAQGDTIYNRTGNKIHVTRITGKVLVDATAASSCGFVRCVVVVDKLTTGTLPTFADVFPSVTNGNNAMVSYVGSENDPRRDRFTVLYDRVKAVGYEAGDLSKAVAMFHFNKRLSLPVYFNGNGALDESKNQIVMFLIPQYDDADIKATYATECYFKDS